MMWDVQRIHGSSGKNASIIKAWFRKHVAREASCEARDHVETHENH